MQCNPHICSKTKNGHNPTKSKCPFLKTLLMSANINIGLNRSTTDQLNIVGDWVLNDNRWVSSKTHNYLLFIERQRIKPNQSSQYLLSVNPSGVRTYVSSVYPRGKNLYKIDYKGINYILERVNQKSLRVSIGICPTM